MGRHLLLFPILLLSCCRSLTFDPDRAPKQVLIPDGAVESPLTLARDVQLVEALVNGRGPYWFLIDTGAFCTIIELSIPPQS